MPVFFVRKNLGCESGEYVIHVDELKGFKYKDSVGTLNTGGRMTYIAVNDNTKSGKLGNMSYIIDGQMRPKVRNGTICIPNIEAGLMRIIDKKWAIASFPIGTCVVDPPDTRNHNIVCFLIGDDGVGESPIPAVFQLPYITAPFEKLTLDDIWKVMNPFQRWLPNSDLLIRRFGPCWGLQLPPNLQDLESIRAAWHFFEPEIGITSIQQSLISVVCKFEGEGVYVSGKNGSVNIGKGTLSIVGYPPFTLSAWYQLRMARE